MQPSIKQISKALFDTDPMQTCCKENTSFDEYDLVAKQIYRNMETGLSFKHSTLLVLTRLFDAEQAQRADLSAIESALFKKF